mmetsp:Transcript_14582/g.44541  ORF Transcript_14582/g.44541 Transcript_14582/m.44541 type:complete len:223 (+) Transcript_14582:931-1599(+)
MSRCRGDVFGAEAARGARNLKENRRTAPHNITVLDSAALGLNDEPLRCVGRRRGGGELQSFGLGNDGNAGVSDEEHGVAVTDRRVVRRPFESRTHQQLLPSAAVVPTCSYLGSINVEVSGSLVRSKNNHAPVAQESASWLSAGFTFVFGTLFCVSICAPIATTEQDPSTNLYGVNTGMHSASGMYNRIPIMSQRRFRAHDHAAVWTGSGSGPPNHAHVAILV